MAIILSYQGTQGGPDATTALRLGSGCNNEQKYLRASFTCTKLSAKFRGSLRFAAQSSGCNSEQKCLRASFACTDLHFYEVII